MKIYISGPMIGLQTKKNQVARVGNSVVPQIAAALVRANVHEVTQAKEA